MDIKKNGSPHSVLSLFDLLGKDEMALSKAFAFILGKEKEALKEFVRFVGIKRNELIITDRVFRKTEIRTEVSRKEGRTDIEIVIDEDIHIIIESKINNNKVVDQRKQYLTAFNPESKKKVMVFLTQVRDSNKQISQDIKIINTSWLDVSYLYDRKKFTGNSLIFDFLKYVTRNYKMNGLKEILIQDLSDKTELKRYREYDIYRRDPTFGTPLYFAPYFTRVAHQPEGEGIPFLSKILGVLTIIPKEIENYEADLRAFTEDEETIKKWIEGAKFESDSITEPCTYYFLGHRVELKNNLLKDGGRGKGRGKNWIAANIPKNRCVTFEEFIKRMNS